MLFRSPHRRLRQSLFARMLAQVDQVHMRGGRAAPGRGGSDSRVAPLRSVLERLERGRGRPKITGTCARCARSTARSRAE